MAGTFPALGPHIVIVPGPSAAGVYDLDSGEFHRVTLDAGRVLKSCDGLRPLQDRSASEQAFIVEAARRGLIALRDSASHTTRTELADVIRPLRPPRFAWVEITSKCNQQCLHCFLGEDLNRSPHVPVDRLKAYADELCELGVRQVVISGGEPTLHPAFEEIISYFAAKSFSLSVLTNGSYKKIFKYIDLFRRFDVVAKIPLLGWESSHDRMTGLMGSFERAVDAIKTFVANGVRVQVGSTITAINEGDVERITAFVQELGVSIEFSPVFLVGFARDNKSALVPDSMARVISVCQSCNECGTDKSKSPSKLEKRESGDYAAVDLHGYLTSHHECGQKILAVLADGMVTPCLLLREKEHRIGSAHSNSLTEIVQGKIDRTAFDYSMHLDRIPGCNECEARFVCKAGGCPASAFAMTGFIGRKNPLFDKCYYENRSLTDGAQAAWTATQSPTAPA